MKTSVTLSHSNQSSLKLVKVFLIQKEKRVQFDTQKKARVHVVSE